MQLLLICLTLCTGGRGAEVREPQAEVPAHVRRADAEAHVLLGRRDRGRDEQVGRLRVSSLRPQGVLTGLL